MNLSDALERLHDIHAHLARAEVFRGYRPLPIALSGLVGLVAALAQPWLVVPEDGGAFLRYWAVVGPACLLLAASPTLLEALSGEMSTRRRARTVFGQFFPCLLAGGLVTAALARPDLQGIALPLLPGLWAVLFGLGVVASLPYLPGRAGWVAGWYLSAGFVALFVCAGPVPSGWAVGVPFGFGQLFFAAVVHFGIPAQEGQS